MKPLLSIGGMVDRIARRLQSFDDKGGNLLIIFDE
jgi:hypothetical protein